MKFTALLMYITMINGQRNETVLTHCTEVCFAIFFSGGFITVTVVNPPEKKLANCTYVHFVLLCATLIPFYSNVDKPLYIDFIMYL